MENFANRPGLFSEEYGVTWQEMLGNFPQAFTHIGYINNVVSLCRSRASIEKSSRKKRLPEMIVQKLTPKKFLLNPGQRQKGDSSKKIAADLKHLMNVLRGAFFSRGRRPDCL
jgi:hypothetical protein